MSWRRITTAAGFGLLVLASLVVAEGTLAVLLLLFSFVLRVNLTIQLTSPPALNAWLPTAWPYPDVTLYVGAVLASFVVTAACGLGAGARRFLRWRAGT